MGSTDEERGHLGSQILQTVFVAWSLGMVGISDIMLGPSLPDLQALLQTDFNRLNYIVLTLGFSEFVGNILAGFVAKAADIHLRLCVFIILGAASIGATVVVANYYYILVFFSLQGLFRGFVYCYAIEKASVIWRNEGVSFQLTSLGSPAGGLIAPLFISPFLCIPRDYVLTSHTINYITSTVNYTNTVMSNIAKETSKTTDILPSNCLPQDVRISYSYMILGGISLPPAVAFFVYWRRSKTTNNNYYPVMELDNNSRVIRHGKLEILFSCLFVIYYFPMLGGQITYSTFLTEFGVQGSLLLEKSKMVHMTSLFLGSILVGRILNLIFTPWLGIEKIIIFNIICLMISGIVLIPIISQSEIILWVLTCAVGIFISSFMTTGYAWYGYHVKFDHKIISASSASLGLGAMLVPFIGGQLFQTIGPVSFLYFIYANFVFVAVVFWVMFFVGKQIGKDISLTEDASSYGRNKLNK